MTFGTPCTSIFNSKLVMESFSILEGRDYRSFIYNSTNVSIIRELFSSDIDRRDHWCNSTLITVYDAILLCPLPVRERCVIHALFPSENSLLRCSCKVVRWIRRWNGHFDTIFGMRCAVVREESQLCFRFEHVSERVETS